MASVLPMSIIASHLPLLPSPVPMVSLYDGGLESGEDTGGEVDTLSGLGRDC